MSAPFFSIITATYNRDAFLPAAIQSVLAQTFTEWELITVDDGSTDSTKDVVQSFNDPRITYTYQKNSHRIPDRHHGLRLFNGQPICFLSGVHYYFLAQL